MRGACQIYLSLLLTCAVLSCISRCLGVNALPVLSCTYILFDLWVETPLPLSLWSYSLRELTRAQPGAWGCVQVREVWSTEEEAHMRPGHFWICKFGTVPGSMSCVEKKFELHPEVGGVQDHQVLRQGQSPRR